MIKINRNALRRNFRELIFVFLAFALLVLAANISIGRILRDSLSDRTEEIMYTADANVRAGLSAAETILLNSYHIVKGMIERSASEQEVLDYLITTTEWMLQQDQGLLGFYGIYAFIHGKYYDSINMNPDSDFIPQMRPWYQTAIRSGDSVVYTAPYVDWRSGEPIFSAVKSIYINDEMVGILSVDISINWLVEYISTLSPAAGGYGMLLSENMVIMVHPNADLLGRMLQALGTSYNEIARILRTGGRVSALRIQDIDESAAIAFFNSISNDWYIGLVIPHVQFFWNLYVSSFILIMLGLGLSFTLSIILLRLSIEKMKSDEESKSKSSFLASMSHEIRTPMNAITGMAELALRETMPDKVRNYVLTIKQAGANLLSIINDILDFSKIEAGILEINSDNYLLSSLINDVVNIIDTRLAEKPIRFVTNIEGNIPNNLIGDEVRIRQILLNLLSNAVKYTEKGQINLSITTENKNQEEVLLKIAVTDTGFGIKAEDQAKLFGEFIQLDSSKNRGIEGTGLGLSITKRLCIAMNGNIYMESEYGKGSTFTVIIPQGIESETPFALDEITADRKGLNDSLKSHGFVSFTIPRCRLLIVDDTDTNLKVVEGLLEPYMARIDTCLNGVRAIELVKQSAEQDDHYDIVFMDHMMPEMDGIEATAIIRAFEKEKINKNQGVENALHKGSMENQGVEFALQKISMENAKHSPKQLAGRPVGVPIIALTANAVSGMRELFLEKGFNDFLAKPIDVSKLDEILDRWISKDKKEKIKKGETLQLKPLEISPELLKVFCRDAEKAIYKLRESCANNNIKLFTTNVHAMKSALANIDKKELSKAAEALENAGLQNDTKFITANTEVFIKSLETLVKELKEKINAVETESYANADLQEDTDFLIKQLEIIKSACEDYDDTKAYTALDSLKEKPWKKETYTLLEEIREMIYLHSDFEGAVEKIKKLVTDLLQ